MKSNLVDESPLVEAFRNTETVTHLESLVRLDPQAISWCFELACTPMGDWIEETPASTPNPRWSAQWPSNESASVFDRLTPPINAVVSLSAHLRAMQVAHTEAVGGPMDGVGYHVVAYRDRTVLSLLYQLSDAKNRRVDRAESQLVRRIDAKLPTTEIIRFTYSRSYW